jgi:hypothetical protein
VFVNGQGAAFGSEVAMMKSAFAPVLPARAKFSC